jgi:hypothetical protein
MVCRVLSLGDMYRIEARKDMDRVRIGEAVELQYQDYVNR